MDIISNDLLNHQSMNHSCEYFCKLLNVIDDDYEYGILWNFSSDRNRGFMS
jgi:hypothetical protein